MNPFLVGNKRGQFVWLDYIWGGVVADGRLQRLIDEDGLGGVTTNPTIFDKAIAGTADYDAALHRALDADPGLSDRELAERLIIEDIGMAADVLRPVYDQSDGVNGFVSLEVSPGSAHDTGATIAEARHLWDRVARPNVMIKAPATLEGIAAVEELTAEGINVNITLMFSLEHYEAVAQAYLRGIDRNPDPRRVVSVASVFVSRLDLVVDRMLEAIGSPKALSLRGRIAIANAKRIYRRFTEIFYGEAFAARKARGAQVQRPLWASTGTKNPAYSDVLYLEALIGPDTITTVPPATMDAFRDHGHVQIRLGSGEEAVNAALESAAALGLDVHGVAEQLQAEALKTFASSFDQLLATLAEKRRQLFTAAS
jgi:transaldolase